ncbi:MAG: hypothetical protein ACRCWF_07935 [Beijerinckiaceae bacterium]
MTAGLALVVEVVAREVVAREVVVEIKGAVAQVAVVKVVKVVVEVVGKLRVVIN